MPMLDAHCHFWQPARGDYGWLAGEGGPLQPLRRDFAPADYPGQPPVIAVQAAPTLAETDHLLDLAARHPRIRGVVGWVDLAAPDAVRDLELRAANPRFLGIRPMLQDIADTDWLLTAPRPDALAALHRLNLRFDALVTPRHLAVLTAFVTRNPGLPVVIDHAAKPTTGSDPDWRAGMARLAAHPWVYCKLSGLLTELPAAMLADPLPALRAILDPLLDLFGAERLIWGSDWPVLTLAADYARWLDLTAVLLDPLPAPQRAAILGGNAATFYGVTA